MAMEGKTEHSGDGRSINVILHYIYTAHFLPGTSHNNNIMVASNTVEPL